MFFRFAIGLVILLAAGCGGGARARRAPIPPPAAPAPTPFPPIAKAGRPEAPEPAKLPAPAKPKIQGDLYEGFEARTYTSPAGEQLQYRLFRPPEYDPSKTFPLIVFLHGASGRGTDNLSQLTGSRWIGTGFWTDPERQARNPAFVLAPQVDPKRHDNWVRQWRLPASGDPEPLELLIEMIPELARELPIDDRRIYLTGYSMGGFATWIGISRHPNLFAAAVAICGGGDPTHVADTITPVWAFHGSADKVVPVGRSREMVKALEAARRSPRYSEYKGAGHAVWDRAYEEPELEQWLFSHRRK